MTSALRTVDSLCAMTKDVLPRMTSSIALCIWASVPTSTLEVESSEYQDGRVEEDGAGDGKPLPLAAREGDAALAHPRVVPVRQALDEVVKLGDLRRPDEVVHGRVVDPVGDVVAYGR